MSDTITVNDEPISADDVAAEAQHHPAETAQEAWDAAAEALVVRQVLLQEARRRGVVPHQRTDARGRRELEEEAMIRELLQDAVEATTPTEADCRGYYDENPDRFRSPDLFEASHILFAASRGDVERYAQAVEAAKSAIAALRDKPELFPQMARELSDCSSASSGGHLGQIGRGDTVPEFETFLYNLDEGQLCPVPVKTPFGAHVLYLHKRILGQPLPYEAVRERIEQFLADRAWRHAIAQWIGERVAAARVDGFDVTAARHSG